MKKLVVYFSRVGENSLNGEKQIINKGFTEILAEKISNALNAPMYKIEPVEPYPFSYDECVNRKTLMDKKEFTCMVDLYHDTYNNHK